MKLKTGKAETLKHDERVWKISKTGRLFLRSGSLFRLRKDVLPAYGIMVTDDNRRAIRGKAEEYELLDLKDRRDNPATEDYLRTDWGRLRLEEMFHYAGRQVKELVKAIAEMKKGANVSVVEMPARDLPASRTVAIEMWNDPDARDLFERTTFHLVDYNGSKLTHAEKLMDRYSTNYETHSGMLDTRFLSQQPDGSIDIIISLFHLHRKPFPDYLDHLHRVLSDDGVLVLGGWHSSLFDHPVNWCNFLESVGEKSASEKTRNLLGPELMTPDSHVVLDNEEVRANKEHFDYLKERYEYMRGELGPSARVPRIHVLAAYKTSKAQKQELEDHGFTTDIGDDFPGADLIETPIRLINGSDFISFMLAKKKKEQERG